MSAILQLGIMSELDQCKTMDEVNDVHDKYRLGFNNAVDAADFLRMINNARARIIMSRTEG